MKYFYGNAYVDTTYHPHGSKELLEKSMRFYRKFELHSDFNEQRGFLFINRYINQDFNGAIFEKEANWGKSDFRVYMSFEYTIFKDQALFWDTNFKEGSTFTNVHFLGNADFRNSNAAHFNTCKFNFIFQGGNPYESDFMFHNCKVKHNAIFAGSHFKKEAHFRYSIFETMADFSNSTFNKVPKLDFVNLPDTLFFRNVQLATSEPSDINKKIDFRLCKIDSLQKRSPGSKCNIKLEGTDLSKVLLPHNLFTLSFDESTNYEMKTGIYEAIIKTCTDNGMVESAQDWDIEYRRFKNVNNLGWFIGGIVNFLNRWWWNFGYSKQYILLGWLPALFMGFWLINIFRIKYLYNEVYRDEEIGATFLEKHKEKYGLSDELEFKDRKYKASYAFFYTATIYFGFKLKHEAVNFANPRGMAYLYLMYALGAIHVAFALSYILNVY